MPAVAPLAGVLLLGWVPVGWADVGVVFVWGLQKARRGHKARTGVFTLAIKIPHCPATQYVAGGGSIVARVRGVAGEVKSSSVFSGKKVKRGT